tara:strand:- start:1668 stop:1892 length:225 start_codon:yes stop_codon:yes gene_type:complete
MQQLVYKRDVEDRISEGYSNLEKPKRRNVSYNNRESHILDIEKKLMKKYRMGFSQLHKYLIARTYQQEFGNPIY